MTTEITREIAIKVLDVVDAGLVSGMGTPEPGAMCVEAAVCFALGLPHSDDPKCVSPALRSLKIALNDKWWSSEQARAKGLRRLAVAQLGSAGVLDDLEFANRCADLAIRKMVPLALRAAAGIQKDPKHNAADAAAYAAKAVYAAERDKGLADFAEDVVQILIKMNAPGCQWLVLTEQYKAGSQL